MRRLVAGNWKAKCTAETFSCLKQFDPRAFEAVDSFIAVPSVYVEKAVQEFPSYIGVAAEDLSDRENGSYTGEVTAQALSEFGAKQVLIGHSERRMIYSEDSSVIQNKLKRALEWDIRPVLCIGEPENIRQEGSHLPFLYSQLKGSIGTCSSRESHGACPSIGMDIAYEPVYSIGTGKVAKTDDVAEVIRHIAKWMDEFGVAGRILYGGSVTADSVWELENIPHLGGVLVGGGSLSEEFCKIALAISRWK